MDKEFDRVITVEIEKQTQEIHEICRDIQVGSLFFHLHTEPSGAQKEEYGDEVSPPWPWWAEGDDGFQTGPHDTPDEAARACQKYVTDLAIT
jgi:hypothetical protein